MKYALVLFFAFALSASAEVRTFQRTQLTDASLIWTEWIEGTNVVSLVNEAEQPWRLLTLEIVQGADKTNNISIDIIRAFDFEAQIVGERTVTNAFGLVETFIDTTVTNRTWRTFTNRVFSTEQTTAAEVYWDNSAVKIPPVYVDGDDVIVVDYDNDSGFFFRLTGEK